MAKQYWIGSLKRGDSVLDFFAAQDKALATTADNRRYLRLRLGDRTGWMSAVAWDNGPQLFEAFENGDIVRVMGEVEEYRGKLQIRVHKLRAATPSDRLDAADFLPSSRFPASELVRRLDGVIEQVANPWLHELLRRLLGPGGLLREAYGRTSAAREVHHAYLGGLLEHVLEMVDIGLTLSRLHPEYANPDVVVTAILLHDVGKLYELDQQGHGFVYTREGELLGHVYLGARLVEAHARAIEHFPDDLREELVHCVLSHHGSAEHGAPVLPRTMNAWIVYLADEASARLNQVRRLYERVDAGGGPGDGWSEYDPRLGIRAYTGFTRSAPEGEPPGAFQPDSA
ncbi:MAG: HD domain-containing protein [Limnochordaceae bacterium]|nr:HD domain-containing protein [Limnochordaceae bacterium]